MADPGPARRLFLNARREALLVTLVWAVALAWVVGCCYLMGYRHHEDDLVVRLGLARVRTADEIALVLGFPDWIWYGIVLPWLACSAITVWFGLSVMHDDDLGAEAAEDHGHGH